MPPRDIILLAEDDLDNRIYVAHSRILEESLLPVSQRYKRHNIKFQYYNNIKFLCACTHCTQAL